MFILTNSGTNFVNNRLSKIIMNKIFTVAIAGFLFSSSLSAQGFGGLLKKVTGDSTISNTSISDLSKKLKGGGAGLSKDDVAAGLKQALNSGVKKGTDKLSAVDGYYGNAAVKVLMPPEAQKVEQRLRDLGLGKQVDDAILSMNRAAEDAAKTAAPIFLKAITSMSIEDAFAILKGSDTAATGYLRNNTTPQVTTAFRPVINQSLTKVDATKYWETVFSTYNRLPFVKKVNTDLVAYVTERAMYGIFLQIANEELLIRKDPLARTTDLLKKVFGQ